MKYQFATFDNIAQALEHVNGLNDGWRIHTIMQWQGRIALWLEYNHVD